MKCRNAAFHLGLLCLPKYAFSHLIYKGLLSVKVGLTIIKEAKKKNKKKNAKAPTMHCVTSQ